MRRQVQLLKKLTHSLSESPVLQSECLVGGGLLLQKLDEGDLHSRTLVLQLVEFFHILLSLSEWGGGGGGGGLDVLDVDQ